MVRFKADFPNGIPVKELVFLADFVSKNNGKGFFFDGEHLPTIKEVQAEMVKSGKISDLGLGMNSNGHCMELFHEAMCNLIIGKKCDHVIGYGEKIGKCHKCGEGVILEGNYANDKFARER